MKAAFCSKYGSAEVLSIREVEIPIPKDDEILIKVRAATVNRSDCHLLAGTPFPIRLYTGLFRPKITNTGTDFAGEVHAIGGNVTSFKPGDKIMGFGGGVFPIGSHAEYLLVSEYKARKFVVALPDCINFKEAAACMEGAFYAAAQVNPLKPVAGQKALVNGATGAIGSSYVQYLKYYGVSVTAVCRGANKELVRSLGADKIIDFTKEDFTKDQERYDFVFDAVGKSSFPACKKLLKKNGAYTSSDGFMNIFYLLLTKLTGGKKVVFSFQNNFISILNFIKELIEKGKFKPVIDREYTLEQIADAYRYVASGEKIGTVIITMDN